MTQAGYFVLGVVVGIILNILYVRHLRIQAADWPIKKKEEPKEEVHLHRYSIFVKRPTSTSGMDFSSPIDCTLEDFPPKRWYNQIYKIEVEAENINEAIYQICGRAPEIYYGMGRVYPQEASYAKFAVYELDKFKGYFQLFKYTGKERIYK